MATATQTAGEIVAPNIRDLDELATLLAGWLQTRMPQARDIAIANLAYPFGAGMSHETILFDADWTENGAGKRQGMVVRIKPTEHLMYQDDQFAEQYALMQAMHDSGLVRVAQTFWLEEDPSILGAPFFVMEKRVGKVAVSFPPYSREGWLFDALPAQRRSAWEDSVRQLASIQRVPVASVPFLVGRDGLQGFEQEWDRWRRYRQWVVPNGPLPFVDRLWAHLEATRPANRPDGIVWGDARLGNMMIGPDFKVAAVMDWEAPSLGGALHDLAWWIFSDHLQTVGNGVPRLDGMGSREETIALWEEVSGKSAADIEWYETFAGFKMCCLAINTMNLRQGPAPGQDHNDNGATRMMAKVLGWEAPAPAPASHR